ncbi:MAG: DUF2029 domain-containing protein [Candidatus Eremiobacteraeota bacterium]|nr:DUF2029 domain-containing protein [Candidatus Eremiobacteraeota bacterium]
MELVRRFLLVTTVFLIVAVAQAAAWRALRLPPPPVTERLGVDFRVVYCGAEAIRAGADPYRVEPLRACEHRIHQEHDEPAWSVTPMPLPSYAVALFVPLTFLPFATAEGVYFALMILAIALASATLGGIVRKPSLAVALVLAPTAGLLNIVSGEPVPLVIAAIATAAYLLERGKAGAAGFVAPFALIEPHVGLPALLALLLFVRGARVPALATSVALGLLGFLSAGTAVNAEYFQTFLPLHASAELAANGQYSVSRIAFLTGAPPRLALEIGLGWYALMVALGVALGKRLAADLGRPSLALLVPVAAATFGGVFIHDVQIAAALPAAIVLAPFSWSARIAIALLVVRWNVPWHDQAIGVALAGIGAAIVGFGRANFGPGLMWLALAPALALGLLRALPPPASLSSAVQNIPDEIIADTAPSSLAWKWRIALAPSWSTPSLRGELEKIPYWFALALLLLAGSRRKGAAEPEPVSPATPTAVSASAQPPSAPPSPAPPSPPSV